LAADPSKGLRVAVVVPCHNDGRYLLEVLGSVDESEPVEIVVVDDCSTDPETIAIFDQIEADGVRVCRHTENRGPAASRNTGVEVATAPYIFPLDADDLAISGALTAMADCLDAAPDAAVCFGDYIEFGDHITVRAVPERLDAYRLAYTNEYPVSSLFRRSALEAVGGWRHIGAGYEDWDLWMTLVEHGYSGVHLGQGRLTYRRRLHGARMLTTAKRSHRSLYLRLKSDHPALFGDIDRHRAQSDLSPLRKFLYPRVYGGRRRFTFESRVKHLLDRWGIWTLRR
jgi:glycosyltransferase involved in cell wall biosynthesis